MPFFILIAFFCFPSFNLHQRRKGKSCWMWEKWEQTNEKETFAQLELCLRGVPIFIVVFSFDRNVRLWGSLGMTSFCKLPCDAVTILTSFTAVPSSHPERRRTKTTSRKFYRWHSMLLTRPLQCESISSEKLFLALTNRGFVDVWSASNWVFKFESWMEEGELNVLHFMFRN